MALLDGLHDRLGQRRLPGFKLPFKPFELGQMVFHPWILRGGAIYSGGHRSPSFGHCFSWQDAEAALNDDLIRYGRGPVSAMNRPETDRRNVVRIFVQWI